MKLNKLAAAVGVGGIGVVAMIQVSSAHESRSSSHDIDAVIASRVVDLQSAPPAGAPVPVPEGPAFDRSGDLYFVSVYGVPRGNRVDKVFKLSMRDNKVTPVYSDNTSVFTGLAIHRDGSLYLADYAGAGGGAGQIVRMNPDGTDSQVVIDAFEGEPIHPDDLVFDAEGNLFFTDMVGDAFNPIGRVIRVAADGTTSEVLGGLAYPNGIALSEGQNRLVVSENLANRLVALGVDSQGAAVPIAAGASAEILAHFSGGTADSTEVDRAGNIYQAMYKGGRVEALDPEGNPLFTVRPPRRAGWSYPNTTHVVLKPGTKQAYLLAGDKKGVSLLQFTAEDRAKTPFSHR